MTDTAALRERLDALQLAYDRLIAGEAVAAVNDSGSTVTYKPAEADRLLVRIREIEMKLNGPAGFAAYNPLRRG